MEGALKRAGGGGVRGGFKTHRRVKRGQVPFPSIKTSDIQNDRAVCSTRLLNQSQDRAALCRGQCDLCPCNTLLLRHFPTPTPAPPVRQTHRDDKPLHVQLKQRCVIIRGDAETMNSGGHDLSSKEPCPGGPWETAAHAYVLTY